MPHRGNKNDPRHPVPARLRPLILGGVLTVALMTSLGFAQDAAPPSGDTQASAAARRGTLAIRAVQGTKDAPAITGAEVEIDMVVGNRSLQHYATKMDDQGLVMLGDVPVGAGVRPLVRIKYAGVTYQEVGPEMTPSRSQASMAVTVYETTEEAPPWKVSMRHMLATPGPMGFQVSETVVVENPSDRTWIGGTPDEAGKRPVVRLSLPSQAQTIQLDEGFHGWCCTKFDANELTVQMPLMPGQSTFKYSYRVPVNAGLADLKVRSAAPIDHAVFFVPDDVETQAASVTVGGVQDMGAIRMKMFQGSNIAAGSDVGVVVLTKQFETAPTAATVSTGGWVVPFVAGMGLMLVIGAGVVVRLVRRPQGHAPRRISGD